MPRCVAPRLISGRRSRRSVGAIAVTAFVLPLLASLAATADSPRAATAPTQDVFAAIEAGELEVGVVPRDARRLTIQLKNKTDRPLTIQLPPALAAAPILAQQQGLFQGFPAIGPPNQNNRQSAPQQLGLGQPQGNNNNGGNNGLFPGGVFNIPAGKAIKVKADCVCLEYGKPEPDARMKYQLKPLAEVNDEPELAAVLQSLGKQQLDQRAAQAAAWRLTNDLTWEQIAALVQRQVGGVTEMQFTAKEVAGAKAYLEKLDRPSPRASASRANK